MNRKKKEFAVALALLSASSALCLRIMKKVDEKLRREKLSLIHISEPTRPSP